jgi:hypothetical protein
MATADEYRQHAAACLRAAQAARGVHVKATLGAMAQHWNEAAERAERFAAQVADWKELAPIGAA